MAVFIRPKTIDDVLKLELERNISRSIVTLEGGSAYEIGAVLARVNGKHRPLNPAGTGEETIARAVCLTRVDATLGDRPGGALDFGGLVDPANLIWPDGITDPQKAAAIDQLDARGVKLANML
uniref:Bacteriophage lambda head decoration protein D n=1 Tax=Candidatus Kentrum sp. TC TaxID=2126339 RepID=A0A450YW62_9GAMM|nr:MAG: Bacteriophage lambda head decoration protein D [Candidatus Kentron sp. TC]